MFNFRFFSQNIAASTIFLLGAIFPVNAVEVSGEVNNPLAKVPLLHPKELNSPSVQLAQGYKNQSVTVFGRTNCPITQLLMKELKSRKIPYTFKSVDLKATDEEIAQLSFENNINLPSSYRLPAVEVNNTIMISSKMISSNGVRIDQVLAEFSRSPKSSQSAIQNSQVNPVIIYTTQDDNYSQKIIKGLQRRGITFSVKDLKNPAIEKEFWALLKQNNYGSKKVDIPVLSVNNQTMIYPNFQEILAKLSQN
jgi:glutaredoxin